MRSERRNFYRILHLQPDAPPEVVRSNFLALMQKLRIHPDLGGEHWDAAQVSEAYAILSDAERRAEYDRELLESYDLASLGQGCAEGRRSNSSSSPYSANRRNYYRVLQVQREAPHAVIEASYAALRRRALEREEPVDLLDEAFETLRDPDRRLQVDAALEAQGSDACATTEAGGTAPTFEPQITSFCAFCKTPSGVSECEAESACRECQSPLFAPPESLRARARRNVARTERNGILELYRYWPSPAQRAKLVDLSPTGMRFSCAATFDEGEVIKIDSRNFRAVGEVAHRRSGWFSHHTGIRFVSVIFRASRGGFVSMRA